MVPLFGLVEVVARAAGHNILLMIQIIIEHLKEVHDLGLIVDKSQHGDSEGVLHLCVLKEPVQDNIGVGIMPELDDNAHAFPVGFIPKVSNPLHFLILDKIGNLLDQIGLVDQIRKLCHDNAVLSVLHGLDVCHRAGHNLAPAGHISLHGT